MIRESFRDAGKVRKRTLANITPLPDETIEQIRRVLKGGRVIDDVEDDFHILRSLPYANVKAAQASAKAKRKAATKKSQPDDLPVHSFQTLLADLATVTRNTVRLAGQEFDKITTPTPLQQKALNMLNVRL